MNSQPQEGRTASVPEGVPVWQPDEEASACFLCHTPYSLFYRRHHCRKCGKVVCANCSTSRATYLASTYVVTPPSQPYLGTPHVPHRTCDNCMEELEMVRQALRGGSYNNNNNHHHRSPRSSGSSNSRRRRRSSNNTHQGPPPVYDETLIQAAAPVGFPDDINLCPVCGVSIANRDETRQEEHIRQCVERAEFSGSPEQHRRNANRMVVHQLPEKSEVSSMGECTICFEDYKPGEKVGRLECLCVYHERCILDWFSRKGPGSCPVHAVHL